MSSKQLEQQIADLKRAKQIKALEEQIAELKRAKQIKALEEQIAEQKRVKKQRLEKQIAEIRIEREKQNLLFLVEAVKQKKCPNPDVVEFLVTEIRKGRLQLKNIDVDKYGVDVVKQVRRLV